ncbi:MAG TPA: cellulose binding domain-containing protein, partial [Micromonosporaceae bacterium]|nr:cellulose binding domain-containing protein [Micromonosporaceae bacterium]
DTTPPTVPGTPVASAVTSAGATLSWAASTDTGGSGLAGYTVSPMQVQSATNTVTLTGLTPSTTYQVTVRARDNAGNVSAPSGVGTFTTAPGGGGAACRVAYSAQNWGGGNGFTANVVITNTGGTPIDGWTVQWSYANGQRVTQMWNATFSQPAATVAATNMDYNRTIGAGGGTANFGFNGSWNGVTNTNPASFTLNGVGCPPG